ncbi:MAG TPA: XdhC family protein [Solirubrobacteraceae bacterium]|nr:XdhC family protein [Solirubrobacteraceae bacterium]
MTSPADVIVAAGRLAGEGKAYALATVVDVRRPASTRRGDRALVTLEGSLIGWVGGACSEPIVIRESLRALADGRPRLVHIGPRAKLGDLELPTDAVLAESHCASEGVVEVLVEPHLPTPLLAIVGDSPAARTLSELAASIGWRVANELTRAPDAVVVATMGRMDEEMLAMALAAGARYVGLVASSRRAGAVLGALRSRGLDEEQLARVRSPAGLDLGPGTQEEIAVAILAELVAWSHTPGAVRGAIEAGPFAEAVDPVCGMTVPVPGARIAAEHDGTTYWFCSPACRARFVSEPDRYATAR